MKRITPTHFIEVFKQIASGRHKQDRKPLSFEDFECCKNADYFGITPIAIFLIQPATTSLEERMRIRKYREEEQQFLIQLQD